MLCVRIVDSKKKNYWYSDRIGEHFCVKQSTINVDDYTVHVGDFVGNHIWKADCVVI